MLDDEVVLLDIFSPVREDFLANGEPGGSHEDADVTKTLVKGRAGIGREKDHERVSGNQ